MSQTGNTTCKTTSLDWFTQSVGETPCRTYERLRQTCNPSYLVGSLSPDPPGNQCDDQLSACCCNSVAFALSMLCENCQWGVGSGVNGDTGFDAAAGSYQIFLGKCGAGTNQSLPTITQKAVCNQGIKIPEYLYGLFWVDGAWYYEYTRQQASLQVASGQNVTKFCNNTNTGGTTSILSSTASFSSVPNPSQTAKTEERSSSPNIGAIAGGIVGGVGLLVIAALVFWFSRRRQSRRNSLDLGEDKQPDMSYTPYIPPVPPAAPAPHAPPAPPTNFTTSHGPSSSSGYTYTNASSDAVSSYPYPPQPRPTKPGMIARSPPTREEIRPSMTGPLSSTDSSDRHEDSEALSAVYGLGRSASGRLPPSYDQAR
ncbi:hypothetical protein RhiJN_08528 [Ceratobasidium sp. AG-Ba]|nr:hypothetical protein RhiJN_08528 [Ceratobasidium sp. AG-Ba]